MGYSISWIATNGPAPDEILGRLGLTRTGRFAEYAEADVSGSQLPSGWFLLVARGCDNALLQHEVLASLARDGCRVVACSIEEHMMYCRAEEWHEGLRVGRVEHDAQKGMQHLQREGTLPAGFEDVEQSHAAMQRAEGDDADVDFYFEIPLQTAKNIVRFKHDEETPGLKPGSFEAMTGRLAEGFAPGASARPESREPWWQFWN